MTTGPSERSSTISIKVYASFELGPRLGNEELLDQFKTTVGDVLDRNEELQPIRVLDKKVLPSRSSLRIITGRRICDVNESTVRLVLPASDAASQLEQLTDTGHRALLRYRHLHNQRDIDEAITYFGRVRGTYPPDDPNHSAVLFSLATARFIHCQDNNHYRDLHVPITLYQDALQLRTSNHRDHPVTALDLCFVLLARLQRQGEKADRATNIKMDLSMSTRSPLPSNRPYNKLPRPPSTAGRRGSSSDKYCNIARAIRICSSASGFARSSRKISDTIARIETEIPAICSASHGAYLSTALESKPLAPEAVRLIPNGHPDKPAMLGNLGGSLFCRFERPGDLADIDESISMFEQAVRLTPNGHPDKPALLNNLGRVGVG